MIRLRCDYEEIAPNVYYVADFLTNPQHWSNLAERCDKYLQLAGFYVRGSKVTGAHFRNQKIIPWAPDSGPKIQEVISPAHPKEFLAEFEHIALFSEFARMCQEKIVFDGTEYFDVLEVQRTTEGGYFKWHKDRDNASKSRRFLSVLCYLNDGFQGGETDFMVDGSALGVTPVAGDAVVFDADLLHRGRPVISGIKRSTLGIFAK